MSDFPQGTDWWKADDGLWYAPEERTDDGTPPAAPGNDTGPGTNQPDTGPKVMKWLYVIAFIVVLGILFSTCDGDDGDSSRPSAPSDLRHAAFDVCTQFVENQLKAPGTASFRNYFQDDGEVVVSVDGNVYTVRSSVDAENSFGAKIRTDFECTVRHTSGSTFRLVNLETSE